MGSSHCRTRAMKDDILSLWHAHRQAALPDVPRESMGELWVLDEVIGGCVNFYLQAGGALDAPRRAMLEDCRADLPRLLQALEEQEASYFSRLKASAGLPSRAKGEGERKAGPGPVDDHLGTCNSEACPLPLRRRISKAFNRALG